jgi:hypothetical protein
MHFDWSNAFKSSVWTPAAEVAFGEVHRSESGTWRMQPIGDRLPFNDPKSQGIGRNEKMSIVLDVLDNADRPLTATEVAHAAGFQKSHKVRDALSWLWASGQAVKHARSGSSYGSTWERGAVQ